MAVLMCLISINGTTTRVGICLEGIGVLGCNYIEELVRNKVWRVKSWSESKLRIDHYQNLCHTYSELGSIARHGYRLGLEGSIGCLMLRLTSSHVRPFILLPTKTC